MVDFAKLLGGGHHVGLADPDGVSWCICDDCAQSRSANAIFVAWESVNALLIFCLAGEIREPSSIDAKFVFSAWNVHPVAFGAWLNHGTLANITVDIEVSDSALFDNVAVTVFGRFAVAIVD